MIEKDTLELYNESKKELSRILRDEHIYMILGIIQNGTCVLEVDHCKQWRKEIKSIDKLLGGIFFNNDIVKNVLYKINNHLRENVK